MISPVFNLFKTADMLTRHFLYGVLWKKQSKHYSYKWRTAFKTQGAGNCVSCRKRHMICFTMWQLWHKFHESFYRFFSKKYTKIKLKKTSRIAKYFSQKIIPENISQLVFLCKPVSRIVIFFSVCNKEYQRNSQRQQLCCRNRNPYTVYSEQRRHYWYNNNLKYKRSHKRNCRRNSSVIKCRKKWRTENVKPVY